MTIQRVRVGDVLELQRRAVDVDPTAEYREIGVRSFGRGIFHKEPLAGAGLGNKRVFWIEPGDLVLSNVFAWEGAIAIATADDAGRIGSHRFMTYVPKVDSIDVSWTAWFFLSEPGLALIRSASPGSAGRNKTLAIERFEKLEIPLPPIDEQRRVAARLDRVAHYTDVLQRQVVIAARLVAAVQSSLTSPNVQAAGVWAIQPLSAVLELNCDEVTVSPADVYPIAGVLSFGKGLFARSELAGSDTSYSRLHRLSENQIVMSRLKAWEGAIALVQPSFSGYFLSPEFPTFDVDRDSADPDFLDALLTSPHFWQRLKGESQGLGARKERVTAERFLAQQVSLPPLALQRTLAETLAHARGVGERGSARAGVVDALLPSALNQAFSHLN